jgi:hypothetical protein
VISVAHAQIAFGKFAIFTPGQFSEITSFRSLGDLRPPAAGCLENPSETSKDRTRTTPELPGIFPEGRAARHSTSKLDYREPFAPKKGCGPVLVHRIVSLCCGICA